VTWKWTTVLGSSRASKSAALGIWKNQQFKFQILLFAAFIKANQVICPIILILHLKSELYISAYHAYCFKIWMFLYQT